jgi:protein phosphatase
MKNNIVVDTFGTTHKGKVRPANEDQFLVGELGKTVFLRQTSLSTEDRSRLIGQGEGLLMVVSDGLGGHGGGDVASRIAVRTILNYVVNIMPWFVHLTGDREDDLQEELVAALERSKIQVERAAEQGPERIREMGCTLTMACLVWPMLYVIHVGDSRCYLHRHGILKQITRDHTFAQELVDQGTLNPEQVEKSIYGDMLTNLISASGREMNPEVYRATLRLEDTILLCSDGLNRHLPDEEIVEILDHAESAAAACDDLLARALEGGGEDNITIVVGKCKGGKD